MRQLGPLGVGLSGLLVFVSVAALVAAARFVLCSCVRIDKRDKKMSDYSVNPPLLTTLAHLFDHEEDLPDDPVARLRHIGWVFAEKLYEHGDSGGHTLDDELRRMCDNGGRNKVVWCPASFSLRHPYSANPLRGWFLDVVVHVDSYAGRRSGKFAYKYHSPVDDKEHGIDLTIRNEHHEFACFVLKGQNFYWHTHQGYNTIMSDHGGHYGVVHCVAIRAATVTYARYDPSPAGKVALVHRLFTTSHESCVSIKHWGGDTGIEHVPYLGNWALHNQLYYDPAHDAVLNHNEGANASRNRLENLARAIRAITKNTGGQVRTGTWIELPLLSERLSNQRRSRFVRIARTLLIHRAQAREEARARDPVRKCAACAIEAVKSQLALGLGHKRQRVSVA